MLGSDQRSPGHCESSNGESVQGLAECEMEVEPLSNVDLNGSIDMQMIIEQGLDQEAEIHKHLLDTKELQEHLERSGIHAIVIDENTDFNSPEFRKLGERLKNET